MSEITNKDIDDAKDFAEEVSPFLAELFGAEEEKPKKKKEKEDGNNSK